MNLRVVGLAAIAIMLTALTLQVREDSGKSDSDKRELSLVFDSLAAELGQVTDISLIDPALGTAVKLQKLDDAWVVSTLSGYPADTAVVNRFLIALSELEVAERKTAKPENHERLGLSDNGFRIELQPSGLQLVVGKPGVNGGRFARFPEQHETFLTRQPLDVTVSVMDWVDAVILNIPDEQVQSVRIAGPQGDGIVASRDAHSDAWQVENLPPDRELQYPTILDNFGRLLVNLRMVGVAAYDPATFESSSVIVVGLQNDASVQLRTAQYGEDYWLRIERDDHVHWQYRISEFTYNELSKDIDDLLMEEAPGGM